jgi:hypothetical protein
VHTNVSTWLRSNTAERRTTDATAEAIRTVVSSAAREVCGKPQRRQPGWFQACANEIHDLQRKRNEQRDRYATLGGAARVRAHVALRTASKELRRAVRRGKDQYVRNCAERCARGGAPGFWEGVKGLLAPQDRVRARANDQFYDDQGKLTETPEAAAKATATHFTRVYNIRRDDHPDTERALASLRQRPVFAELDHPFTMVEIRAAIQRARPGKAASNHVPMEAYKALLRHPHALQPLLHLFNRILLNSHADLAVEQSNIEADDPTPAPPPRGPAEEADVRHPAPVRVEAQHIPTWEETARALEERARRTAERLREEGSRRLAAGGGRRSARLAAAPVRVEAHHIPTWEETARALEERARRTAERLREEGSRRLAAGGGRRSARLAAAALARTTTPAVGADTGEATAGGQQPAPAIGARAAAEGVAALAEARKYCFTVQYQQENPKRPGTISHRLYELYKAALTIQEARDLGARVSDPAYDYAAGYMVIIRNSLTRAPTNPDAAADTHATTTTTTNEDTTADTTTDTSTDLANADISDASLRHLTHHDAAEARAALAMISGAHTHMPAPTHADAHPRRDPPMPQ